MTENAKRVVLLGLDMVEQALAEARAELGGSSQAALKGQIDPLAGVRAAKDVGGGTVQFFKRPVDGELIEGAAGEESRSPAKAVGRVGPYVLLDVAGRSGQVAVKSDRFRVASGATGENEFAGPDGVPLSVEEFAKPDCTGCGSFPCRCVTKGEG